MSDPTQPGAQDRQVEIDDLDVGKETITDLTETEAEGIEGGAAGLWAPTARNCRQECSNQGFNTGIPVPPKTTVGGVCGPVVVGP